MKEYTLPKAIVASPSSGFVSTSPSQLYKVDALDGTPPVFVFARQVTLNRGSYGFSFILTDNGKRFPCSVFRRFKRLGLMTPVLRPSRQAEALSAA